MECKAITNIGTQCSRIAELNSKYCWQHQNYDVKESELINISNQYFQNIPLLQNTLLSYFSTQESLGKINKKFYGLDYEKYLTHIQPHGLKITYYDEDKKPIYERETYKNGVKNGLYEKYYRNGQLMEKINYKNDVLDGLFQQWHKNGQLWVKCYYKNGKLNGLLEKWYDNGQLSGKRNYDDNILNGLYEEWYVNGKLSIKCHYKDGLKNGLYEEWYDNGQLWMKCFYKNENINGLFESWYDDGE
jgi:antitoxin component YwqK of YwqJK toxin-antitoxin module